jgi:hypothetical protein
VSKDGRSYSYVGTVEYMPPEIIVHAQGWLIVFFVCRVTTHRPRQGCRLVESGHPHL